MARIAFTPAEEDDVIELYRRGHSAYVVAQQMKRSRQAVINCLHRHSVALRSQAHQIHIDTIRANGSLADRLRGSVRENKDTGCWEFIGPADTQTGYGQTSLFGRRISIHRLAWLAYCGPIPRGLEVCHRCDNRVCGNPEHLFLGTRLDNMRDAQEKGRLLSGLKRSFLHRGERGPRAKLTWEKVRAIRAALAAGKTRDELATEYGVDPTNIHHIQLGKTWKEGWHA